MKRRAVLVVTSAPFVVLGLACVDLFHGTDFETLCIRTPDDPACVGNDATTNTSEAGSDGALNPAPPRPDFCAWSSTEAHKEAVRACAWLGACEGPLGESIFGPCVARAHFAFDCAANPSLRPRGKAEDFWACLASTRSCDDVDRCVFPAGVQPCNAVLNGSSSACGSVGDNTSVRLQCAGPAGRAAGVEPCVMLGQTCHRDDPSTASCSGIRSDTCDAGCMGTFALNCAGPELDCAGYGGGSCISDDVGVFCTAGDRAAACPVTGPTQAPTCEGASVTSCVGGKEIRIDCGRLGLPCDLSRPIGAFDPTAACINRAAGACNEADSCLGNELRSCGRGALETVDCASVGLGACQLDAAGHGMCSKPASGP